MLREVVPFSHVWRRLKGRGAGAGESIVRFFEKRFGAQFVYDRSTIPYGREDMADLFEIAETLRQHKVIKNFSQYSGVSDEPQLRNWRATCGTADNHIAGGISSEDDRHALTAALAEALERTIWFQETDYFVSPRNATSSEVANEHALIPERFVGFSSAQRAENSRLTLHKDTQYLWIRGYSHTSRTSMWVPAQVVSGKHGGMISRTPKEPRILDPITTGLATGETRTDAILGGALEVIERDAYMIMWMNQIVLPRISHASAYEMRPSLKRLLAACERYRLRVHFIQLITDVPTHVICAVVEDLSDTAPRFSFGLKAHRNLGRTCEGALLEALRMRHNARFHAKDISGKEAKDVNHMERISYWNDSARAETLRFLISGKEKAAAPAPWDSDTAEQHLARIVSWAEEKHYEMVSVSLGTSKRNPLPWAVEMVVMPELQPMHQNERYMYLGGERLQSIPKQFGYAPREKPYADAPHPFA